MSLVPVIPLVLIWLVVSLVQDDKSLQACSLASRIFLVVTQRRLFKSIHLGVSPFDSILFQSALDSSPHLTRYVTSLSIHCNQLRIASLLPLLPNLHHLKLIGKYRDYDDWPSPVLGILRKATLPRITHLELQDVAAPLCLILACTRLLSLSLSMSDVGKDDLGIPGQEENNSIFWTERNPLFLGHFTNMVFLQISMGRRSTGTIASPNKEISSRLRWLAGMVKQLTNVHPLTTLYITDAYDCWRRDPRQSWAKQSLVLEQCQIAWTELDDALHTRFELGSAELKLPCFQRVAISPPEDVDPYVTQLRDARQYFILCLPICAASNKLVFEGIDIEEFFWSHRKSEQL
ncbi:hypothetical protein DL96DRAFT_1715418 [Flagelloscypha sp. PMI_526]|nr:hypothetical protein DL96DRAFT_1715418 [Flagelloscypha sp. PMI_526]